MDEYEHLLSREGKQYAPMHRAMYKTIVELLRDKPAKIFEVGFGIGYGLKLLLNANCVESYMGIEIEKRPYMYVKQNVEDEKTTLLNQDFLTTDVTDYKKYNFDFALCIEVIEHLKDETEAITMLVKLNKFVYGTMFMSTPKKETDVHGKFTGKQIREMLTISGWKFVEIEWQFPHTLYICKNENILL